MLGKIWQKFLPEKQTKKVKGAEKLHLNIFCLWGKQTFTQLGTETWTVGKEASWPKSWSSCPRTYSWSLGTISN